MNTRNDIAFVIESAEDTRYVYTLSMLNTIHQTTYISRNWVHSECVKSTIKHMSFDTGVIERFTECSDCRIWILSSQKINLFECSTVSFNTCETTHINDYRSNTLQLIFAWLKLT